MSDIRYEERGTRYAITGPPRTLQRGELLCPAHVRRVQVVLAVVASPVQDAAGVQAQGRDDCAVLARLALDGQLLDDLWFDGKRKKKKTKEKGKQE